MVIMVQSRKLLKNEEKELEEQKVGIAEGVVSLHNLIVIPRFHLAVPFFLKKKVSWAAMRLQHIVTI